MSARKVSADGEGKGDPGQRLQDLSLKRDQEERNTKEVRLRKRKQLKGRKNSVVVVTESQMKERWKQLTLDFTNRRTFSVLIRADSETVENFTTSDWRGLWRGRKEKNPKRKGRDIPFNTFC